MNDRTCSVLLKAAILITLILGLVVCFYWYPFSTAVTSSQPIFSSTTHDQRSEMFTQLVFYWATSVPCFIILALLWVMANEIKKGKVFTKRNYRLLHASAIILFVDLTVFLVGNCIFLRRGWNRYFTYYLAIIELGIALAIIGGILSRCIDHAANFNTQKNQAKTPLKTPFPSEIAIILIGLCGLFICAYYYPLSTLFSCIAIDPYMTILEGCAQIGFYWLTSIPCFIILVFGWKIAAAAKKETLFNIKTAKTIKNCVIILLIDLIVYIIGSIVFAVLKLTAFIVLHMIVVAMGLAVSAVAAVLSNYTFKAAALMEKAKGTI